VECHLLRRVAFDCRVLQVHCYRRCSSNNQPHISRSAQRQPLQSTGIVSSSQPAFAIHINAADAFKQCATSAQYHYYCSSETAVLLIDLLVVAASARMATKERALCISSLTFQVTTEILIDTVLTVGTILYLCKPSMTMTQGPFLPASSKKRGRSHGSLSGSVGTC
jgi:hypothetical protein